MSIRIKARQQQPFEIKNKTATSADIIIYGAIGASWFEDSISAKQFSDELKALDKTVTQLNIRINSPGGDVFDGITIYNRLKQHPANKTVYIDGLAASMASIIALAGNEVIMGEGALYMIHLPWTFAMGNRNDLEKTINLMTDIEEQMISIYSKRSGLDRNEIKLLMENETWMDATEAIDKGFVDKMSDVEALPIAASVLDKCTHWKKKPKMKTESDSIKNEIENVKNNISKFIARK